MSEDDIIDSGITMPRLRAVEPLPHLKLRVEWAEGIRAGREQILDLSPIIVSYKVLRTLRDEKLFSTAQLAEDGFAVAWEGDDLIVSAETIESLADQTMSSKDFAAFLARNKLTQEVAAVLLGRSRRQIANYLSTGPIPRVIALACYGFEARKRDQELATQLASRLKESEALPPEQSQGRAA